jgi:hypothetical protein
MPIFNYFWYFFTEQIPKWVTEGPDIWFFLAGPGFALVAGFIFLCIMGWLWFWEDLLGR